MVPWLCRLSVTVGIFDVGRFVKVPTVKSTGPIPRIPSTPEKPDDEEATPIDCLVMVRPVLRVTVSVYSVPIDNCRYFQLMISLYVIPEK
jgi:hypothetical protein